MTSISKVICSVTFLFISVFLYSQHQTLSPENQVLYEEHIKGGQPDKDSLLIRKAFVVNYSESYRIPMWVAYHLKSDYMTTPQRKGKFKTYRTDKDLIDPVQDAEFVGLHAAKGYARGHLAPFNVLGGDRNNNQTYAVYGTNVTSDSFDEETILQGNMYSNLTAQHHGAFNGSGGMWYKLERWVQDDIINTSDKEAWIYAGSIIIDFSNLEKVGKNNSIAVPQMFYKIVIMEEASKLHAIAFLFPHHKDKDHIYEKDFRKYIVPVDYIECLTDLNFFPDLDEDDEESLESSIDYDYWKRFLNE